jgi:hypothetical protein
MPLLTIDDLQRRWAESLLASQQAIRCNYSVYRELKRLVRQINTKALDVAEYYPTAVHLGTMLRDLSSGCSNSVFQYFAEQIDPRQQGDVRCFRMECRQLSEQLAELDRRRTSGSHLRIIPSAPSSAHGA